MKNNSGIEFIGNNGPWILFFGTCILLLFTNYTIVKFYIFGFFVNFLLNRFLKQYIFNKENKPQNSGKNTMPSGHTQSVFFSIAFLSFLYFSPILKQRIIWKLWISISIIIGIVTAYNCIRGGYHTIDQVEIGILFGIAMGYVIDKLFSR